MLKDLEEKIKNAFQQIIYFNEAEKRGFIPSDLKDILQKPFIEELYKLKNDVESAAKKDLPEGSHPLKGKKLKIISGELKDMEIVIQDWWHIVYGKSWMLSEGNTAVLDFVLRGDDCPTDNYVVYGTGKLVHNSQIDNKVIVE